MSLADEIEGLIGPTIEAMGYRVVRVKLFAAPKRTLQVMAERADGSPVVVDDCAMISRAVSAVLDVEDPIPGKYDLEVSSTGIDRPLVRPEDFERFAGFEAVATVDPALDGQRRFRGRLIGLVDGKVRFALKEDRTVDLPFEAIGEAKLVLTDELVKAMTPPKGEREEEVE
jgi:ribosome maturation factor RimP